MQNIHSISGAGRFFGCGDRRNRPLNYQNKTLKCPRCDSINTKFCYYNNYNLSQPRHFCKSCRRYWTKGGVLRNVPVGGGCRKTKRFKPDKSSAKKSKSNENSSSESSSLTTTTPARAPATPLTSKTTSFEFPAILCTNPNFESSSSEIGRFDPTTVNFNRSDVSPFRLNHEQSWQLQSHVNDEMKVGFLDQTVHIDLPRLNQQQSKNDAGFAPLDWQLSGGGDQGLFEFTTNVDQSYWNQNQWPSSDHDHTLYLP